MAKLLGSDVASGIQENESREKYAKAKSFFHATPLAFSDGALTEVSDSSVATDQGSVQFHLIGHKPDDAKYSGIMQENADNLLAMGGLIYDYMHRAYPKVNLQSVDIDTWVNVINNLPDLTFGQVSEKSYTNRVTGVRVSGQFLSMVAKAIITDGASLLTDFTSYLNSIGDITFSASNQAESYNTLTCTYLNYLVADNMGGYFDYAAIALRQVNFYEHFQELRSSCASERFIDVSMRYKEVVTIVQSRRIRSGGPDYVMFQDLTNKNATEQFKKAKNFFNGGNAKTSDVKPTV